MQLSDEELGHLERLARLKLDGESREKLRGQLERIIEFVKQLQAVDTGRVTPGADTGTHEAFYREDGTGACLERSEVLGQAPETKSGMFSVPPVIETDDT